LLSPYALSETDELSYEFVTDQEVKYKIYFLDYGSVFNEYLSYNNSIYTFNIDIIETNAEFIVTDERIGLTVVQVLKLFFAKIENVIIYVCDSIDDRQLARKRKFDFWFWKYSDGTIIKEDGIAVIEDVEILSSLLINKSNPHVKEVILAFKELNEKANEK